MELRPPPGFDPARLETWPRVDGRLEWVGGRLLYAMGDRLPAHPELPGLEVEVAAIFRQVSIG